MNQEILTQKINAVFDDVIYDAAYKFYNRISFRLAKLEFNIQQRLKLVVQKLLKAQPKVNF